MSTDIPPPSFQNANPIELVSVQDSKIISVSVYAGRAEVTRLFKFSVATGQNQLNIVGLPRALDQESFKVEGRGAATIHDVTLSTITSPPVPTSSPELVALLAKKKRAEKTLARTLKSLNSLATYLASITVEHLEASKLKDVMRTYDTTAEELDEKVTELERELKEIEEALVEERKKLAGPSGNDKLNLKATIGLFAESEGEINIALIYAVHNATWSAGYDIRVDMQTKEKPVTLIYKGSITQSTGEDWTDVPLTLETAAPTFGVGVPSLTPWTLSVYRPTYFAKSKSLGGRAGAPGGMMPAMMSHSFGSSAPSSVPTITLDTYDQESTSEEGAQRMQHRGLQVSSRGTVSATFAVPGLISIPSDGVGHSVTIATLNLDASMSWVSVPKKDSRVHLKAKIKNASEYTLLSGNASVYVDGSFISKSDVPLVSPDESFDCPLGLDPSIRITYQPRSKKVSQSGFYNKSTVYTYVQRITVHNTKSSTSSSTENLKIKVIDQVPVSENSTVIVKLVQPSLTLPGAEGGTLSVANGSELKVPPPVKVASGVLARWEGADEDAGEQVDVDALGRDGKFAWVCTLPPQGKIGLVLQWEVSAPAKTTITGL